MRVAFIGKGGSGKSTLAGTVARMLAREGRRLLALDVDTLPGLAFSIGLGRVADGGLPTDLAERREKQGWVLREPVSAESLVERHALAAPDGVRFLQLGKLPGNVKPASTVAFRHVLETFRPQGWSMVGDLAAGTRQGFAGWAGFATLAVIVMEPTSAALLSAKRLRRVGELLPGVKVGLAVNKVRDGETATRFSTELQLPLWAEVPYDPELAQVERAGLAPIDAAPGSAAVTSIGKLVDRLRGIEEQAA
jgi:CO dehydrogenase maturation factor